MSWATTWSTPGNTPITSGNNANGNSNQSNNNWDFTSKPSTTSNNNQNAKAPNFNFNFPGSSSSAPSAPTGTASSISHSNPMQDIQRIADQYAADKSECRFQTVLYNQLPPHTNPQKLNAKPTTVRPQIWEQGVENNPDPKRLYPVAITGYKELSLRSGLCLSAHVKWLKALQSKEQAVRELKEEMEIKIKPAIADLKQNQLHLSHRLLAVLRAYVCRIAAEAAGYPSNQEMGRALGPNQNASNLPLALQSSLHCRGVSAPLSAKEKELKTKLDGMTTECREMMNSYTRISRLWAQLEVEGAESVVVSNDIENPDPRNMKQIFEFLKQQQSFIQLLTNTMQSDMRDLNIIRKGTC